MARGGAEPASRRDALLKLIEAHGYMSLAEAARALDVSEQTIRRDVLALQDDGRVRRTHGGITFTGALDRGTYQKRLRSLPAEKVAIAEHVAGLVPDGASVFLDSGTTCEAVAEALLVRRNMRVVTYSIRCAMRLADREDFTVAIPRRASCATADGRHRRPTDDGSSSSSASTLPSSRSRVWITPAISATTTPSRSAGCGSRWRRRGRPCWALTSDKFGVTGLVDLADLSEVDSVVVKAPPSEALTAMARAKGVRLLQAG